MTDQTCQKWFVKKVHGRDFWLDDAPWSGRPVEVDSNQIETLIENNQCYSTQEIADILKIVKSVKLLVKIKNVLFILQKKIIQTFWPAQYIYTVILFSPKKEWSSNVCSILNERSNSTNVLKTTELYTLKWWSLLMNYMSAVVFKVNFLMLWKPKRRNNSLCNGQRSLYEVTLELGSVCFTLESALTLDGLRVCSEDSGNWSKGLWVGSIHIFKSVFFRKVC